MPPSWDDYFLAIADTVSSKATCQVKKVGTVFVAPDTHSVLSLGYNGSPRGTKHCDRCVDREMGKDTHLCRAVHAEMNAIFNAALNGVCLKDSVAYSTLSPCQKCAEAYIQVGCKRVVYMEAFVNKDFIPLFVEAKVIWNHRRV